MKLTDLLVSVGRPVAYYPQLAIALGGVKQAVLLCQLIYWMEKGSQLDCWIYKSADELTNETGLSYKEQKAARERLVELGLIKEHYERLKHRMHFQVQKEALDDFWEDFLRTDQRAFPESPKGQFGNNPNGSSGNDQREVRNTESTSKRIRTENTAESFANNSRGVSNSLRGSNSNSSNYGSRSKTPTLASDDDFEPDSDSWNDPELWSQ